MKLLVLTSEAISADELRSVVDGGESSQIEVMVVAPALQDSAIRFWLSDADQAISRAKEVSRRTVEGLGDAGIPARGDTGESEPLEAIEDALRTFRADKIIVFTRPESEQRYREDVDDTEVKERFGLPVEQVVLSSSGR